MPRIYTLRLRPIRREPPRIRPAAVPPEPVAAPDPEPDPIPTPTASDLAAYSKAELIAAAEARGLDSSGTKAEILTRLAEHERAGEASDDGD